MGYQRGGKRMSKLSTQHKKNIAHGLTGHKRTEREKELVRQRQIGNKIWLGRKHTEESKRKMRLIAKSQNRSNLFQSGENHPRWKGGITEKNHKIRTSTKYKDWRLSVFERDNYTCVWCGQVGHKLQADHIKPFADYPQLRFDVSNGRTLCYECHRKTDTWCNAGKIKRKVTA